jgi:hypothetical protein
LGKGGEGIRRADRGTEGLSTASGQLVAPRPNLRADERGSMALNLASAPPAIRSDNLTLTASGM